MRRCRNTWPNPQRSTPGDLFGPRPCATCCTWQPGLGRLLPGLTGSHPRRSPHGRARESNPPGRTRSTRRRLPWPAHTLLSPREPRRESRSPTPCRSFAAVMKDEGSALSDPCALYLAPTKALANDQARSWRDLALPGIREAVVDGDSNADQRAWARRHANVVLTNPDMLHYSLLPGHERWSRLLRNLRYIVVDEAHAYRGVFGAHVSLVLRRLRRLAEHHRSSPVVIAASATSGAPERSVARLIGAPVTAITEDSSPTPERTVVLWQSPTDDGGSSATRDAAALTSAAVREGCQVLTFLRSRRAVEYVASLVREQHADHASIPSGSDTIAAYRGGFLAEERRALEDGLRSGSIRALATTNALELGIDIAGMDVVVTAGWPGTRSSLWQQFGRAGRGTSAALAAFVAREDPLDTYLVQHPEALTAQPFRRDDFRSG